MGIERNRLILTEDTMSPSREQQLERAIAAPKVVGIAVAGRAAAHPIIVAATEDGATYFIDPWDDNSEWKALPPVPGTSDDILDRLQAERIGGRRPHARP